MHNCKVHLFCNIQDKLNIEILLVGDKQNVFKCIERLQLGLQGINIHMRSIEVN